MIRGCLTFSGVHAPIVQQALAPDNLSSMRVECTGDRVVVYFEAERIGSLLLTVDDYLMNARIAEELCMMKK